MTMKPRLVATMPDSSSSRGSVTLQIFYAASGGDVTCGSRPERPGNSARLVRICLPAEWRQIRGGLLVDPDLQLSSVLGVARGQNLPTAVDPSDQVAPVVREHDAQVERGPRQPVGDGGTKLGD